MCYKIRKRRSDGPNIQEELIIVQIINIYQCDLLSLLFKMTLIDYDNEQEEIKYKNAQADTMMMIVILATLLPFA